MDVIYLDNNATTRLAPEVLEAMMPYLTDSYGNPSSIHRLGQQARHAVEQARGQVAQMLGCAESEVFFTGGGTEAINTAIEGLLACRAPRRRIVTSAVEHPATRQPCDRLQRQGIEVLTVRVNRRGELDMDALAAAIDDRTAVVSVMWANNETGVILPVEEIASLCRAAGVPFHCDGTQAIGKIPVDVKAAGMDALSFAAHKFHGPKGVGALYVRRGLRLRPLVVGGPQEQGRRGGTENVPGIVGLGKAAELAAAHLPDMPRVALLRDRLEQGILGRIPDTRVNGRTDLRLPNTTNIGFARLQAEAILLLLSEQGVCASAGSACSSGSLEPSPVLRAMGIEEVYAHGSVRFSLSRYTTGPEIDRAMEIIERAVAKLRQTLPVMA